MTSGPRRSSESVRSELALIRPVARQADGAGPSGDGDRLRGIHLVRQSKGQGRGEGVAGSVAVGDRPGKRRGGPGSTPALGRLVPPPLNPAGRDQQPRGRVERLRERRLERVAVAVDEGIEPHVLVVEYAP